MPALQRLAPLLFVTPVLGLGLGATPAEAAPPALVEASVLEGWPFSDGSGIARIHYRGAAHETPVVSGWPRPTIGCYNSAGHCFADARIACSSDAQCPSAWGPDDPQVAAPTAPSAGVATVLPIAPTWCAGYAAYHAAQPFPPYAPGLGGYQNLQDQSHFWFGPTAIPETLPLPPDGGPLYDAAALARDPRASQDVLATLAAKTGNPVLAVRWLGLVAAASCDREHYAPRQRRVANWLQQWVNTFHMPLAEVHALMAELIAHPAYMTLERGMLLEPYLRASDPVAAFAVLGFLDYAHYGWTPALEGQRDAQFALGFDLDAAVPARVLDLAMLAIGEAGDQVIAAAESAHLDWSAFEALLDQKSAVGRFVYGRALPAFRSWLALPAVDHRAYDQARAAYETAVSAQRAAWDKLLPFVVGGLDARGNVRKDRATAGCAAVIDPLFTEFVLAQPPTGAAALAERLADPTVALVIQALGLCPESEFAWLVPPGRDALETSDDYFVRPRFVGPVTFVTSRGQKDMHALVGQLAALFTPRGTTGACADSKVGTEGCAHRQVLKIAKADPAADGVHVTWATYRWTEDDNECTDTKAVDHIESDGKVVYVRTCKTVGHLQKQQDFAPSVFAASLAPVLKPGRVAQVGSGREQVGGTTFLVSLYADLKAWGDAAKPLAILNRPLGTK